MQQSGKTTKSIHISCTPFIFLLSMHTLHKQYALVHLPYFFHLPSFFMCACFFLFVFCFFSVSYQLFLAACWQKQVHGCQNGSVVTISLDDRVTFSSSSTSLTTVPQKYQGMKKIVYSTHII